VEKRAPEKYTRREDKKGMGKFGRVGSILKKRERIMGRNICVMVGSR
jgi:hypothetical protein